MKKEVTLYGGSALLNDVHLIKRDLMDFNFQVHNTEKSLMCNQCGKMFRREINLKAHMITHTGSWFKKSELTVYNLSDSPCNGLFRNFLE